MTDRETFKAFQPAIQIQFLSQIRAITWFSFLPVATKALYVVFSFVILFDHNFKRLIFFANLYRGDLMNYFCCMPYQQWLWLSSAWNVLINRLFKVWCRMMLGCTLNLFTLEVVNGIIGKPFSWVNLLFNIPLWEALWGETQRVHIADGMYMCVLGPTSFFMRVWAPFIALLSDTKFIWGLFSTSPELTYWHITWSVYLSITDEMNAIIFTVLVKCYCLTLMAIIIQRVRIFFNHLLLYHMYILFMSRLSLLNINCVL